METKQLTLRVPDEIYGALREKGKYFGFNIQNFIMLIILNSILKLKYRHEE